MEGRWVHGIVKSVPCGDTIVIRGPGRLEKTITLSSLVAPRLARFRENDETFAWESREFLRKLCIGKNIIFRVDYSIEAINREFGSVIMGETNLAIEVVSAGWAKLRPKVRENDTKVSPFIKELEMLEEQAKEMKLGVWNTSPSPSPSGDAHNFDALTFLERNRGNPLPAIVEYVHDGSTVKICSIPELDCFQMLIAGIQCPIIARQVAVNERQMSFRGNESEPVDGNSTLEKYAMEAKRFTEVWTLHRDVTILLEGADNSKILIGSLCYHRHGGSSAVLSVELLKNGLAKVVEWSAKKFLDIEFWHFLKNTELIAKTEKLRLWDNYIPPRSNLTAIHDNTFKGRVVEVVSGDCVIVLNAALPSESPSSERSVNLSSIRAPKMGRRGEDPAPYAREAKEFLRIRLIGRRVSVMMEYSRKASVIGDVRTKDFGAVFLESASTLDSQAQYGYRNVAEMVVAEGLATVVIHNDFEVRSKFYDELVAAEARARKGMKGVHSGKEPPSYHFTDLTGQESSLVDVWNVASVLMFQMLSQQIKANRAAAYRKELATKIQDSFTSFKRYKRLPAIVDYILTGHRYKLIINKESCVIILSLATVRCPTDEEPYADYALRFMRHRIQQRDVEVEIKNVDRAGTFFGTLWDSEVDVSKLLLAVGLAKHEPLFRPKSTTGGHLVVQSEEEAKKLLMKVWEGFGEGKQEDTSWLDTEKLTHTTFKVRVTEVVGGGKFYAQSAGNYSKVLVLQWLLKNIDKRTPVPFQPKTGDTVMAQFSVDGSWYRAKIVDAPGQSSSECGEEKYEVFYIDYGNQEKTSLSKLMPLEAELSSYPALASLFSLAHVKIPEQEDDYGLEAAQYLSRMIGEKDYVAKVVREDTSSAKGKSQGTVPKLSVILYETDPTKSINKSMIEAGFARVEKTRSYPEENQEELEKFLAFQELAKEIRLNIWSINRSDPEENQAELEKFVSIPRID